jgi:hypothetical protein
MDRPTRADRARRDRDARLGGEACAKRAQVTVQEVRKRSVTPPKSVTLQTENRKNLGRSAPGIQRGTAKRLRPWPLLLKQAADLAAVRRDFLCAHTMFTIGRRV